MGNYVLNQSYIAIKPTELGTQLAKFVASYVFQPTVNAPFTNEEIEDVTSMGSVTEFLNFYSQECDNALESHAVDVYAPTDTPENALKASITFVDNNHHDAYYLVYVPQTEKGSLPKESDFYKDAIHRTEKLVALLTRLEIELSLNAGAETSAIIGAFYDAQSEYAVFEKRAPKSIS